MKKCPGGFNEASRKKSKGLRRCAKIKRIVKVKKYKKRFVSPGRGLAGKRGQKGSRGSARRKNTLPKAKEIASVGGVKKDKEGAGRKKDRELGASNNRGGEGEEIKLRHGHTWRRIVGLFLAGCRKTRGMGGESEILSYGNRRNRTPAKKGKEGAHKGHLLYRNRYQHRKRV